jgi:hypothetical protein
MTFPMNVLRKTISIAVLLTAGMASVASVAYAGPYRDDRDAARAERAERREQFREPRQPNAGRQGEQGADNRRPGRMSPEERRALRRQINEAGHDIYQPRR